MEKIQRILGEFGAANGIPDLMFDETDSCTLVVDDGTALHLQYDRTRDRVLFMATLGSVPEEAQGTVYGALLYANLFWAETQGATLALEIETGEVVLQFAEEAGAFTELRFEQLITNFADTVLLWQARIAALTHAVPVSEDTFTVGSLPV